MKRSATIIGAGLIALASGVGYVVREGNAMLGSMHAGKMALQRLAPQVTASHGLTATVWDDSTESVMTISYEGGHFEHMGSLRAFSAYRIAGRVRNQNCTSTPIDSDEHRISNLLHTHHFPAPGRCSRTVSPGREVQASSAPDPPPPPALTRSRRFISERRSLNL